jgi:hypothetical protein
LLATVREGHDLTCVVGSVATESDTQIHLKWSTPLMMLCFGCL